MRLQPGRLLLATLLVGAVALTPGALRAQGDADPSEPLRQALAQAQRDHLWRVAAWGGLNLAAGLVLVGGASAKEHPTRRGFGIQTAAWGAINLGIATWGLASGPAQGAPGLAGALAAEDGYAHVLLVNLGLNVGYAAVGTAVVVASRHGLRGGPTVRGHGSAVLLQGLGLLALDGLAYAGSRGRLEALRGLVATLEPGPAAGTVSATLLSLPLG